MIDYNDISNYFKFTNFMSFFNQTTARLYFGPELLYLPIDVVYEGISSKEMSRQKSGEKLAMGALQ